MPWCDYCNDEKPEDHWRLNHGTQDKENYRRKDCKQEESDSSNKRQKNHRDEEDGEALKERIDEIMKFVAPGEDEHRRMVGKLAVFLNGVARGEHSRLGKITEKEFYRRMPEARGFARKKGVSFEEAQIVAYKEVEHMLGFNYPTDVQMGDGTYLVVGDSYGMHTKNRTFDLIRQMHKFFKFKKIIHVGQLLDDDGVYSWHWDYIAKDYKNVVIVSKKEEIRQLVRIKDSQRHGKEFAFDIVRDRLHLGDLNVQNQDVFVDNYTRVGIKGVEQSIFETHTMFNFCKHEMDSRTTPEGQSLLYMGVGALADPFVVKTKRMFDWKGDKVTKEVWTDGFKVYRKRDQMKDLWEMGCYIVEVRNGHFTPIPLRIYDIDYKKKIRAVGLFDQIITSRGRYKADKVTLVTGDHHAPMYDPAVHDIIDQIACTFKFDTHVNLGDLCHFNSVNHHNLDTHKLQLFMFEDIIPDAGIASYLLGKMEHWAPERYLIFANHERFTRDFIEKNPQFKSLLDISKLLELEQHGIILKEHLNFFLLNGSGYTHGDLRAYGAPGNKQEKIARVFNGRKQPIFIGHIHYPSIRFGCYSVGLAGLLDQKYNEPEASRWMHGLGGSTSYKGIAWNTTIPIIDQYLYLPSALTNNKLASRGCNFQLPQQVDFSLRYTYQ